MFVFSTSAQLRVSQCARPGKLVQPIVANLGLRSRLYYTRGVCKNPFPKTTDLAVITVADQSVYTYCSTLMQ
jgi:hypothetical protein